MQLASAGLCCSQVVMQLALSTEGVENPQLVRSVAGLCNGTPMGGGACGAFTGACCLLGLYGGCDQNGDSRGEEGHLDAMLDEFSLWFQDYCRERHKSISCQSILDNRAPSPHICGNLIKDCYLKAVEVIQAHGYSFGEGLDD